MPTLRVEGGPCANRTCTHHISADTLPDIQEHLEHGVLGGTCNLTLNQLADKAGLPVDVVKNFWLWLGEPVTDPTLPAYNDFDAAGLRMFADHVDYARLPAEGQRELLHALGSNLDRLAMWQIVLAMEVLSLNNVADADTVRTHVAKIMPEFVRALYPSVGYIWVRKCLSSTKHLSVDLLSSPFAPDDVSELPYHTAVGFVDIAGFTKRTAAYTARQITDYLGVFEGDARDIIANNGGRTIKMIGDKVFFASDNLDTGADVAFALTSANAYGVDSPVRVSLVWGRCLTRFGDLFGPAVNLAALLTKCASPGEIVIDTTTAAALASGPYILQRRPQVELEGFGSVSPVILQRNG
jgi:adenylate cyclase